MEWRRVGLCEGSGLDAEDRERRVADCIPSAVGAVNHISGVASHHSSDVSELH